MLDCLPFWKTNIQKTWDCCICLKTHIAKVLDCWLILRRHHQISLDCCIFRKSLLQETLHCSLFLKHRHRKDKDSCTLLQHAYFKISDSPIYFQCWEGTYADSTALRRYCWRSTASRGHCAAKRTTVAHFTSAHTLFYVTMLHGVKWWSSAVQLRTHTCCGTKQSQNTF